MYKRQALLATQISSGKYGYFGPDISPDVAETTDEGFPIGYAVPATFGQVGQILLVAGDVDDEGARYSTLLQTPAENTFVYEYMSC